MTINLNKLKNAYNVSNDKKYKEVLLDMIQVEEKEILEKEKIKKLEKETAKKRNMFTCISLTQEMSDKQVKYLEAIAMAYYNKIEGCRSVPSYSHKIDYTESALTLMLSKTIPGFKEELKSFETHEKNNRNTLTGYYQLFYDKNLPSQWYKLNPVFLKKEIGEKLINKYKKVLEL